MRCLSWFGGLCLVLAACSSGGFVARPSARATPVVAAVDSLAAPWHLRAGGQPRAQRLVISAVLSSRIDTIARVDSLSSAMSVEWSYASDAMPRRVTGMVRAFELRGSGDTAWRSLDAVALPVSFVADQARSGGSPQLTIPDAASCAAQAAVVQGWRETWVDAPAVLQPGTRWRDSTASPVCRDGLLLHTAVVREFVAERAERRGSEMVVLVRRTSTITMDGRGVQFGDSVHVSGTGEGTAQLAISLDGGAIVAGEGVSELRLTLKGRRRTQELVQHSALSIARP
jgi:hypothetical protein